MPGPRLLKRVRNFTLTFLLRIDFRSFMSLCLERWTIFNFVSTGNGRPQSEGSADEVSDADRAIADEASRRSRGM